MMKQDVWLTVEEAKSEMFKNRPDVTRCAVRDGMLCGFNEYGVAVVKRRVFDGTEHANAKAGMVLSA